MNYDNDNDENNNDYDNKKSTDNHNNNECPIKTMIISCWLWLGGAYLPIVVQISLDVLIGPILCKQVKYVIF